jgi:hypothetical protein
MLDLYENMYVRTVDLINVITLGTKILAGRLLRGCRSADGGEVEKQSDSGFSSIPLHFGFNCRVVVPARGETV